MSLLKYATLAAIVLSASSAVAGDTRDQGLVGAWQPPAADASYTGWTVLAFSDAGRFAALVARHAETETAAEAVMLEELAAASGSWTLGEDGGEVVLAFDNPSATETPGSTRYLQMLLLGDELHPYPGMAGRSPIAATSWRRIDGALQAGR